jgi:ABC-type multidrug transport system, ATPase component
MKEVRVKFKEVGKIIKQHEILAGVSFEVDMGEVVGIIGENGSGKTTILRLASGLSYATSGAVSINGQVVKEGLWGELPPRIGILIETPTFMKDLTGFANLKYLSQIRNAISTKDIKEAMKQVGLEPENKKRVGAYSLGMRQRLGIAQAIMEKPDLILFDEPTNGLDQEGIELFEKIVCCMKKKGTSFIFVSHSKNEIERLCDRVLRIDNKTIVKYKGRQELNIARESLKDVDIALKSNIQC